MNGYSSGSCLRLALAFAFAVGLSLPPTAVGAAPAKAAKSAPQAAKKTAAKTRPAARAKTKPGTVKAKAAPVKSAKSTPLPRSRPVQGAAAVPSPLPPSSMPARDVTIVKQALEAIRRGKIDEAHSLAGGVQDRASQKLIEWAILRSDYNDAITFERYIGFIKDNPTWPSLALFHRRAEAALWEDRRDARVVRAFFAGREPVSSKGRLVLARALVAQGDRKAAESIVREVWRRDSLSRDLENMLTNTFGDMLTRADHKARMDHLLYAEETEAALRIAQSLGATETAIAKARVAMIKKAANAKAMLDAVPAEGRRDPGYMFNQIQWLRRADKIAEAGQLMLTVTRDPAALCNLDQWWLERRYLARKLLDVGDPKTAYRVAADAVPPPRENYRVDHQFTAGWIALRFLNDPATALTHFARIPEGITNPHALARADYWYARALEALGRNDLARQHYEAAAKHSTVYYGQIARARLGLPDLPLREAPRPAFNSPPDVVRAAELLYSADERELAGIMLADLGERGDDAGILSALGEVAHRYKDARAMLLLGKGAIGRGLPFDYYAHPTVGLPNYTPIGPAIDQSVAYSIARTESHFNQKVVSTAKALGLMQVTPDAGRYIAKKFKAVYDQKRLQTDPVYNMQMGAAELGDLIQYYRGSYILTFAGYNAGRGRVKDWIERFGDPRDPKVDPIDWVERIPFAETRNYVPRILEALQVYRIRFGGSSKLLIEADLRRGSSTSRVE